MLQTRNSANDEILININGELVPRAEAKVSVYDRGFLHGDCFWEGLRLYPNGIFRLRQHLARLREGATRAGYQNIPDDDYLIAQLKRTLLANSMVANVHIRLKLTRGENFTPGMDPRLVVGNPTVVIIAEHKAPVYDRRGITLITSQYRRCPPNCLDQTLHTSNQMVSILAKMEATERGADDALMLDLDGNLAETNATNVFAVCNGELMTSTTRCCPEGITRGAVLELCEQHQIRCAETDIPALKLSGAEEMFCTGTMGELVPVVSLDQQQINGGIAGPLTTRLSALFAAMTQDPSQCISMSS